MAAAVPKPMTVAEFLAFEDGTDTRYELVNGAAVAMRPPSERHTAIASAIAGALFRKLVPPCRPYMAVGVAEGAAATSWCVPGIFVACVAGAGYSEQPRLLIDIRSPSSEKDDRTTRLDFYKTFPSLEAILFVWQDTRRVELHERSGEAWIVTDRIGTSSVRPKDLPIAIDMDEVYAG